MSGNTVRKRTLEAIIRAHAKENLEKGGTNRRTKEILPGQFSTGVRQVQVVESANYVAPPSWVLKFGDEAFEKELYKTSFDLYDVEAADMPANVDILTLDNVIDNPRAPCEGKVWNPETPLYGTDSCNNPVFVIMPEHPFMGTAAIMHMLDNYVDRPRDCGSDNQAGARAAILSALAQLTAQELANKLLALGLKDEIITRVCDMRHSLSAPEQIAEKIAEWTSAAAAGEKLEYNNGENFGADLHAVAVALLRDCNGKSVSNTDPDRIGNSQVLFMLNRLGIKGVIQGEQYEDSNGEIGRNFVVSSTGLPGVLAGSATDQVESVLNYAAGVPVIINNGARGYSIRLPKVAENMTEDSREYDADDVFGTTAGSNPQATPNTGKYASEQSGASVPGSNAAHGAQDGVRAEESRMNDESSSAEERERAWMDQDDREEATR